MTWLWQFLQGAPPCNFPHADSFLTLLLSAIASAGFNLIAVVLQLMNFLLKNTLFDTHYDTAFSHLATSAYDTFLGIAWGAATVAVAWQALQIQLGAVATTKPEGYRALVGRAGVLVVWMVGTPVFIGKLLQLNGQITASIVHAMGLATQTALQCPAGLAKSMTFALTDTAAFYLGFLFWQFALLALLAGIAYAVLMWLARIFEIIFWSGVAPLAIAASFGDPQQRAWTYVRSQLVGTIFLQSVLAIGFFFVETLILSHGGTPQPVILKTTAGAVLLPSFSARFPLNLLLPFAGALGFFFLGRIPRYWQELQGHTAGGGHDTALALAGGYMLGRFGGQMLQATKGGQLLGAWMGKQQAASQAQLRRSAEVPLFHQAVRQRLDQWAGQDGTPAQRFLRAVAARAAVGAAGAASLFQVGARTGRAYVGSATDTVRFASQAMELETVQLSRADQDAVSPLGLQEAARLHRMQAATAARQVAVPLGGPGEGGEGGAPRWRQEADRIAAGAAHTPEAFVEAFVAPALRAQTQAVTAAFSTGGSTWPGSPYHATQRAITAFERQLETAPVETAAAVLGYTPDQLGNGEIQQEILRTLGSDPKPLLRYAPVAEAIRQDGGDSERLLERFARNRTVRAVNRLARVAPSSPSNPHYVAD